MSNETWTAVDRYVADLFLPPDPVLDATLASTEAAGLPAIQVSATQGMLLHLLALTQRAETILEVGTLVGYSTIWMARALPENGRLITLEVNSTHAQVAQANIDRADLSDVVDIRLGNALDTLPQLAAEGVEPFDLIFIDADKQSYPDYFTWAIRLSRGGSLIVIDNVVRNGQVIDADSDNPMVQGVRRLNELISAEPRVQATVVQTVGAKGYDGFALVRVIE